MLSSCRLCFQLCIVLAKSTGTRRSSLWCTTCWKRLWKWIQSCSMSWQPATRLKGRSKWRLHCLELPTLISVCSVFREKKREREREELWKRLHELADEIQKTPSLPTSSAPGGGGAAANSDGSINSTSTSNQNNTAAAASSAQSHSAGPTAISTQMNSMSISGAAAMSKWCNNSNGKSKTNKIECCWFC